MTLKVVWTLNRGKVDPPEYIWVPDIQDERDPPLSRNEWWEIEGIRTRYMRRYK